MATGPLRVWTQKVEDWREAGRTLGWRYEGVLVDTPNVSALRERLVILTHVPAPLPSRLRSVEEAALLRARALLDQQIQTIRSAQDRSS